MIQCSRLAPKSFVLYLNLISHFFHESSAGLNARLLGKLLRASVPTLTLNTRPELYYRHPGEGRGLRQAENCSLLTWVPAFAGMTEFEQNAEDRLCSLLTLKIAGKSLLSLCV